MWKLTINYYKWSEGSISGTMSSDIQDVIVSAQIRKSSEPKNNVMNLTINNPIVNVFSDGTPQRKWVDDNKENKFRAARRTAGYTNFEERVELYSKWVTDVNEDIIDDNNLLFSGQIFQVQTIHAEKGVTFKLTCSDRTFNLLNRIASNNFSNLTGPVMIKTIVQQWTEGTNMDLLFDGNGVRGNGDGYRYPLDIRLFSEGTKGGVDTDAVDASTTKTIVVPTATFVTDGVNIGDIVKNETTSQVAIIREVVSETSLKLSKIIFITSANITVSDGFIQDFRPRFETSPGVFIGGDAFPALSYGKGLKPLVEWIDELVQPEFTNTVEELDAGPRVMKRPMRYYVDVKNRVHMFYPDNTPSVEMVMGQEGPIGDDTNEYRLYSADMKQGVFDIINYIIFIAGTDMNGAAIKHYYQDPSTGGPIVKDSYRPYLTVSRTMKIQAFNNGELDDDGEGVYSIKPALSYPMTPKWINVQTTTVADATEYNEQFQIEARRRGSMRAEAEVNLTASPRWQGKCETRFHNFNPSDLALFTDGEIGVNKKSLRIEEVQHNIGKEGFFTTLSLKEDVEEKN
jgi:hypothetical protein